MPAKPHPNMFPAPALSTEEAARQLLASKGTASPDDGSTERMEPRGAWDNAFSRRAAAAIAVSQENYLKADAPREASNTEKAVANNSGRKTHSAKIVEYLELHATATGAQLCELIGVKKGSAGITPYIRRQLDNGQIVRNGKDFALGRPVTAAAAQPIATAAGIAQPVPESPATPASIPATAPAEKPQFEIVADGLTIRVYGGWRLDLVVGGKTISLNPKQARVLFALAELWA